MYRGSVKSAASSAIDEICIKLRSLMEDAVKRNLADGILLSGGLDSSILALVASKFISLKAFTVAFEEAPGPDVRYASLMAKRLRLKHFTYYFDEGEFLEAAQVVVKAVRSFDPMEIRNSTAIYIALKAAKGEGVNAVITGDGSDELFAGYDFLSSFDTNKLRLELERLWHLMSFSSIPLAESFDLQAKLPYLDSHLKQFAMKLDPQYKVRDERGRVWGKWILRKAFEELLPDEIVWRVKTPIEQGCGTTLLPSVLDKKISNEEFKERRWKHLKYDKVMIRDKEQLFYYEVYRSVIGVPRPLNPQGRRCPQCNSNVDEGASYCRTCGAYPI